MEATLLSHQDLPLGMGDHLEIYHTTGHSPDSICIGIGDLFFIGDILFAPNPSMAGASGWNRGALLSTIAKVLWIIKSKEIKTCLSGHGISTVSLRRPRPEGGSTGRWCIKQAGS